GHRDRPRRVSDQQPALAGDAPQDAADRNETAAALDDPAVDADAAAKSLQRRGGIEAVAIARQAYMPFLAVVNVPRDVAWRQARVEVAVHGRRAAGQNVLHADQKLFVAIELQLARDERARAVCADDEPRPNALLTASACNDRVRTLHAQ